MKKTYHYFICLAVLSFFGCKKDLGNYSYTPPSEPVLEAFSDSTFNALVGDSLILAPKISLADGEPLKDLLFTWEILVEEEARADIHTGYPLKVLYNLSPKLRSAKLTIEDQRNGMKYFYRFFILGQTQFSLGQIVLTEDEGTTRLTFIKPDGTMLPNLYYNLHQEHLPNSVVQLFSKPLAYQAGTTEDLWVVSNNPEEESVIINGNTMLRKKYFSEHFFNPPTSITPGRFEASQGLTTGVINGKLYLSISSTAPFAPDFGKFSSPQPGDYTLSEHFMRGSSYFFGYDKAHQAFVSFSGGGDFMASDYMVEGDAFNPKNTGLSNLLFMQATPGPSYAFFKEAGTITELSFGLEMDDYANRKLTVSTKRPFKGAAFQRDNSKWQKSPTNVFYFTSDDKIYRYNPINEDLRALDADFTGKEVSMIKLSSDGKTLSAGTDGTLYSLDVSVGENGRIIKTVSGLEGSPIDIVIRE